jgi:hypothetical protein
VCCVCVCVVFFFRWDIIQKQGTMTDLQARSVVNIQSLNDTLVAASTPYDVASDTGLGCLVRIADPATTTPATHIAPSGASVSGDGVYRTVNADALGALRTTEIAPRATRVKTVHANAVTTVDSASMDTLFIVVPPDVDGLQLLVDCTDTAGVFVVSGVVSRLRVGSRYAMPDNTSSVVVGGTRYIDTRGVVCIAVDYSNSSGSTATTSIRTVWETIGAVPATPRYYMLQVSETNGGDYAQLTSFVLRSSDTDVPVDGVIVTNPNGSSNSGAVANLTDGSADTSWTDRNFTTGGAGSTLVFEYPTDIATPPDGYRWGTANSLTHRYWKWTITDTKNPSSASVQMSEFRMTMSGVDIDPPTTTLKNGSGSTTVLTDGDVGTKLFDSKFSTVGELVLQWDFGVSVSADGYRFATANDNTDRDPDVWTVSGSDDGVSWTVFSNVTGAAVTKDRSAWTDVALLTIGTERSTLSADPVAWTLSSSFDGATWSLVDRIRATNASAVGAGKTMSPTYPLTWQQKGGDFDVTHDTDPTTSESVYGVDVSDDGNTVVCGMPSTRGGYRVSRWNGVRWQQLGTDADAPYDATTAVGHAVRISGDGNTVCIGGHGGSGSVSVYAWTGQAWSPVGATVTCTTPDVDKFSTGLDMTRDATAFVSSSPHRGTYRGIAEVYAWDTSVAAWVLRGSPILGSQNDSSFFGYSSSISDDGLTVAVSAVGISTVRVYDYRGGGWQQRASIRSTDSFFGFHVSMSSKGSAVVVSALSVASAYVWVDGATWVKRGDDITGINGAGSAYNAVSVNDTGSVVVVGRPAENDSKGAVRVHAWDDDTEAWVQQGRTVYGDVSAGGSVAITADGTCFVVGSMQRTSATAGTPGYVGVRAYALHAGGLTL